MQERFQTLFVRMSNSLGLLTFVTSCSFLGGVGMRGGRFPGGAQWCTSSPNVDKILYRTWFAVISEGGLRRCLYGTCPQNAKHQSLLTCSIVTGHSVPHPTLMTLPQPSQSSRNP
jgi:hypothetical protein